MYMSEMADERPAVVRNILQSRCNSGPGAMASHRRVKPAGIPSGSTSYFLEKNTRSIKKIKRSTKKIKFCLTNCILYIIICKSKIIN